MADLLRVMITDEDLDSRVGMRRTLQRAGFEVAGETGFGTEAVALGLQVSPDLVLISVEEPAARALDTAESLANSLPDTPIVIYSSVNTAEAVRRAMVFGARDYLVKPLDPPRVREAVLNALNQEERRQMRRAGQLADTGGRGMIVTVSGAKGGVGKSVVSVNLAAALRRETSRSVVVVDADTHFGDVTTMLDLAPDRSILDVIERMDSLDANGVRGLASPHRAGIDVLGNPEDDEAWGRTSAEDLERALDLVAQVYDFVVVDTAGAFDPHVRACIEAANLTLLCTSSDVSSVRDTARALQRLERWGVDPDRYRLVLNRATRAEGITRQELATALGVEVFWELPFDRNVAASVQVGQPVVLMASKSSVAVGINALAQTVAGIRTASAARRGTAMWRRVLPRKGTERHESNVGRAAQPASRNP